MGASQTKLLAFAFITTVVSVQLNFTLVYNALLAPLWLLAVMVCSIYVRLRGRRSLMRISGFNLKQHMPACGQTAQSGRNVKLQFTAAVSLRRHERSVTLVDNGQRICMKRYGTIRCASWSWTRSMTLTKRSSGDPCTAVYFDREYKKRMQTRGMPRGRCLSPVFGEWLMGLPAGWTQGTPMAAAPSRPSGRISSLSLFSGCAGLDHGLSPWVRTCLYCETNLECRNVLQNLMRSGHIDKAPIAPSVERLRACQVPAVSMVVAGFPCPDISSAGVQMGLDGQRSILYKEVIRLAMAKQAKWIVLENVAAITAKPMEKLFLDLVADLAVHRYDLRWIRLEAAQVGGLHTRCRWFGLATRADVPADALGKRVPKLCVEELQKRALRGGCGAERQPQMHTWLVQTGGAAIAPRMRMLGNVVVPLQAKTALQYLAHAHDAD